MIDHLCILKVSNTIVSMSTDVHVLHMVGQVSLRFLFFTSSYLNCFIVQATCDSPNIYCSSIMQVSLEMRNLLHHSQVFSQSFIKACKMLKYVLILQGLYI